MKTKKLLKKMNLNKMTIAGLNQVHGGNIAIAYTQICPISYNSKCNTCYSCDTGCLQTLCGPTCPVNYTCGNTCGTNCPVTNVPIED